MRCSRWILTFFITIILCSMAFCGLNIAVDPFGVFGDPLLHWYDYNMTQNPRVAKIPYLEEHHDKYDSYIIGCSKTGGIPVEELNEVYDSHFYSMLMYGGDMYDIRATAEYILTHYEAKNIIVNIGIEEAVEYQTETDSIKGNLHCKVDGSNPLLFYGKYLFANPAYSYQKIISKTKDSYVQNDGDVFNAENGNYDKRRRDVEPIQSLEDYQARNAEAFPDLSYSEPRELKAKEQCLKDLAAIKKLCEERGAAFTLIVDPVSLDELRLYSARDLTDYWTQLAEVTDYWNFSGYHAIAADHRYFYDTYHFRTAVGTMMFDKITGAGNQWIPEDFGQLVTKENAAEIIPSLLTPKKYDSKDNGVSIPILMYHAVGEPTNDVTVSPRRFEEQLAALKEAGYESVSFEDLISYVEAGTPLPAKPIVITFDDGYTNNYTEAYPLLAKYRFKATIAVIGSSLGKDHYKDTDYSIIPHFTAEQGREMVKSGVISIASHSYDMHQAADYEAGEPRTSATTRLQGESEEQYIDVFRKDYHRSKQQIEEEIGQPLLVYTYPNGESSELTEILLMEMGNPVSLVGNGRSNEIVKGLPQSLRAMNRYGVQNNDTPDKLIHLLEGE